MGADTRNRWGLIARMTAVRLTQIAIDTPQLNRRYVIVLNDAGDEIFEISIRSKLPVC
jgi:hypothetical protein